MFVLTASPVLRWAGTKNKGTWLGPEASRAGAATLGWISSWKTQLMSHCPMASPTHTRTPQQRRTHTHTHTDTSLSTHTIHTHTHPSPSLYTHAVHTHTHTHHDTSL